MEPVSLATRWLRWVKRVTKASKAHLELMVKRRTSILPMPIAVTVKRTFHWILRVLESTLVVIQTSRRLTVQIQLFIVGN